MAVRGPLVWMFLMCYIFSHIIISHNTDLVEAKSFSKSEDLEIGKRLKTINKPAVKIIKTIHGERYGCVDFFKQPAFDHPSMKNHTYHYNMRPMRETKINSTGFGYLWENGVGCPIGTVPIRRVTKDDLLRLDSFGDNHKPRGSWNASTTYDPNNNGRFDQNHYAVVRTKNIGMKFNGATMELCVTAPKVEPTQFSSSRFHMQMGNDFVQVGLTVNPGFYKDNQPRTFVYTSAGGKRCFNSNCPVGIIIVRQDFPIGAPIPAKEVSRRGAKTSTYVTMGLIKDERNGNWWFEYGGDAVEVGFWPSSRFHQSFGNYIEWGGEVYRHSASLPRPEMGFGKLPMRVMNYDAYIRHITILDGNFNIDRNVKYVEIFRDDFLSYEVADIKDPHTPHDGHLIFFGGPESN
ncbi:Protein neprosin [Cardamine amara subsp. amara]|uniref:Protein neprosin n=1 Tax=Cardamine amara subsp. amara TaxID=228776 RepID=A0ABD1BTV0_CARAN